jgi:glyoxylase-like metal-dependent hydrolase (beta-lactamase superfamily II)
VGFESGPFHNFPTSHALTDDGTVRLLPTPGHTPGHVCVLVEMDGYQLLITGDCLYTLRHLANDDVQAFGAGEGIARQNTSIRQIADLKRLLPDLVLVPGHDHTGYQFDHLAPGLAKGHLTEAERDAVRRYEATVFSEGGRLRAEAVPRFVPGPAPHAVGSVSPLPPDRDRT